MITQRIAPELAKSKEWIPLVCNVLESLALAAGVILAYIKFIKNRKKKGE